MHTNDMTTGSPVKIIVRFAVPLLVGTLFQQAYNLIDTMIAGYNLGDDAIAAIGATSALYSVLIYFANGMNNGFGVVMSQLSGAGDVSALKKGVASTIILNMAVTLLLTLITLPFLRPLLRFMDTPQEIFEMAHQYIFVILAGMTATIAYNMCAGFMQAVGNSKTPLYFLIASCLINVLLDLLFILGLRLGIAGAALATVTAQILSAVLCSLYIAQKYRAYMPGRGDWRPSCALLSEMLSTGLSMGLMSSVLAVGSIILQKGINHLGKNIITAHTASRRIFEFLMMPLQAIATACSTFVGQNFGAKQPMRIRQAIRQVLWLELVWSVLSAMAAFSCGISLIRMLTDTNNAEILLNAAYNLKICILFFFPLGILFVLRNAMQAMGYRIAPILSSSIELTGKIFSCFFVIPVMGYTGVVLTEPLIWFVCAAFLGVIYIHRIRLPEEQNKR